MRRRHFIIGLFSSIGVTIGIISLEDEETDQRGTNLDVNDTDNSDDGIDSEPDNSDDGIDSGPETEPTTIGG